MSIEEGKKQEGYELVSTDVKVDTNISLSTRKHKGTALEWHGIEYTVPDAEKGTKTILHTMSGVARPGELTAVMGTSGAGKSTLLDVLAGRLDSVHLKGALSTNGQAIDKNSFRKETGYVMQSDALFPLLTVRETIRYAAYLRIANKTKAEKDETAEQIIKLLRLEKCANTIIGDDDNRGLSGGEKRRVSIGVDIVHFPPVIFLDEPTSGLDSTTALSVMDSLKTLAMQQNCTVIMTIHQPSARLFSIIDRVIFLSQGHITYNGEVSKLDNYIQSIYDEAKMGEPPVANPPEVFLDLCDALALDGRIESIVYPKFAEGVVSSKKLDIAESAGNVFANDFLSEVIILMHRALTNIMRTKELFFGRLMASIFFAIMIGTLYLDTDDTNTGIDHRRGFFVFTIAFYYYTSLEALPIFVNEREIFKREYSRGAYRALTYMLGTTFVQFPFMFAISLVYNLITWWLVGLPDDAQLFFFQVLCVFTVIVAGSMFAIMFSAIVPNPMAGQTAGSGLFSVMFLFSGFFIKRTDIPDYWQWLHYCSLFKYAYDAMLVNAFKDEVETETLSNAQVLRFYSVNGVNKGLGIGVLWGWIILFRLIFYYKLVTAFTGSRK